MSQKEMVGTSGAARALGVSEATVRNLVARGELVPAATVQGRHAFSVEQLNQHARAREQRQRT